MHARSYFLFVGIALAPACQEPARDQLRVANPQAQVEFARGMLLHYGFYADQALAAFEKAAAIAPQDPLARWGIALALGPRTNDLDMTMRMERAFKEAQTAIALSQNRAGLARDLIAAVATRYVQASTFDVDKLNRAYVDAMGQLAIKYPHDDDVATLYAESLALAADRRWWDTRGVPNADVTQAVAALEPVLARNPGHIGANHYYIHFIEGTGNPERALPVAKRLEALAPDVGHLLHMPSHIYMRLGDYRAAVRVNRKAVAADNGRRASHTHEGIEGTLVAHTREYLAAAAAMTGQSAVALDADKGLFPLLRFQHWDEVITRPKVEGGVGELEWRIAQVLALTAKNRLREARQQRQASASLARTLPESTTWWADPLAKFLPMAEAEMDARLAWADGNRAASIQFWRHAVDAQDQLTRAEAVLSWFHPLRESLGSALYQIGRFAEAEETFRADLRVNPNNPRSLFGLWHCLIAQKRDAEAASVRKQFDDAWRDADVPLAITDL
jgi:tetratricopeptide (TPR) repeat protein